MILPVRMRAGGPRPKKQELKLRSQLVGLSSSLQRAEAVGGASYRPRKVDTGNMCIKFKARAGRFL